MPRPNWFVTGSFGPQIATGNFLVSRAIVTKGAREREREGGREGGRERERERERERGGETGREGEGEGKGEREGESSGYFGPFLTLTDVWVVVG